MLEYGDMITLENNAQYVVASTCQYHDAFYAYIVNVNDVSDCILGKIENDELVPITDTDLFTEVMPYILDNVDKSLLNNGEENE